MTIIFIIINSFFNISFATAKEDSYFNNSQSPLDINGTISSNWFKFDCIQDHPIGEPLIISGETNAPEGSNLFLSGESSYSLLNPHQKNWDYFHDGFHQNSTIIKGNGSENVFSFFVNTIDLRPDTYSVVVSTDDKYQSHNSTVLKLYPPIEYWITIDRIDDRIIGDIINISGSTNLPSDQELYVMIVTNDTGISKKYYFIEKTKIEKSKTNQNRFSLTINTSEMDAADYYAQVSGVVYDKVNSTSQFHLLSKNTNPILIFSMVGVIVCIVFLFFYIRERKSK
jgi:hypothetical protein